MYEHEGGPFKSVPASVHRSVPALTDRFGALEIGSVRDKQQGRLCSTSPPSRQVLVFLFPRFRCRGKSRQDSLLEKKQFFFS